MDKQKIAELQAIVDNAPDDSWTHYSDVKNSYIYIDGDRVMAWLIHTEVWSVPLNRHDYVDLIRRSNICEALEQAKRIQELEKQLKPSLFWRADNTEVSFDTVFEIIQNAVEDGSQVGDVIGIKRCAKLTNKTYKITQIYDEYEFNYKEVK